MDHIDFGAESGKELHECDAEQHGDWIIFRCRRCEGYERRMNWRTGVVRVENSRTDVRHAGFHFPEHQFTALFN